MLSDRINIQGFSNIDYITYVPMTNDKKRLRGFNQSELIAKYLSSNLEIPCIKLIKKTKKTKSLKNLGKSLRVKELKDAFYPNKDKNIESKNVLLVDDIFTTGTTLNECSKVIYENYLCNIFVATIYNKGR
ncbi:MAG: ComF family protein [Bacillota bacterium]